MTPLITQDQSDAIWDIIDHSLTENGLWPEWIRLGLSPSPAPPASPNGRVEHPRIPSARTSRPPQGVRVLEGSR